MQKKRYQITCFYTFKNKKGVWHPEGRMYSGCFESRKEAVEFMLKREKARYANARGFEANAIEVK